VPGGSPRRACLELDNRTAKRALSSELRFSLQAEADQPETLPAGGGQGGW